MRGAGVDPRPLVFSGPEDLVETPAAEPLKIDRDPGEAEPLQLPHDRVPALGYEQPRDVLERNLDPRQLIMEADAELAEPEAVEEPLRRLDPREAVGGDPRPVRKPRREARTRRPIPRDETELSTRRANLGFRELRLDERVADT